MTEETKERVRKAGNFTKKNGTKCRVVTIDNDFFGLYYWRGEFFLINQGTDYEFSLFEEEWPSLANKVIKGIIDGKFEINERF